MLQFHLLIDMHTRRLVMFILLLALARDLWVVHCAYICRVYTGASLSVHSLVVECHAMPKEIVNIKRQITIIYGNLTYLLPIWRILATL
jgi:hypothetical protein